MQHIPGSALLRLDNVALYLNTDELPMALTSAEIRLLVRDRGWTFVDLAARWEVSVTWMSRLVNNPHSRPAVYDDAFRGLPRRDTVEVQRESRHIRKRKPAPRAWSPDEMFPRNRLFEAIDNKIVEEGTRLRCLGPVPTRTPPSVGFEVLDGEAAGDSFEVDMTAAQCHLADLGLDHHPDADVQR